MCKLLIYPHFHSLGNVKKNFNLKQIYEMKLTSTSILGSAKNALLSLRTPMCSETKASTRSASSGMRDMMAAIERSSRQLSWRGFVSQVKLRIRFESSFGEFVQNSVANPLKSD